MDLKSETGLIMKKLKNKKAAGLDGIPLEIQKTGNFNDLLQYYCNEAYNANVIKSCVVLSKER